MQFPLVRSTALLGLALAAPLAAQDPASTTLAEWDVAAAHGPGRDIEFQTDEGTWMSVDVSPDGRQLAFDLLGDIYLLPIEGGEATLLLGGSAYETQPRFSPDGRRIAFTSDRGGMDNLWVVDVDGSDPLAVTRERERQVNSPVWTPDGQYLIGRKHYRNTRSLGAGEMWLYHIGGGGGLQVTERRNWEQNAGEPALTPDGRYLFYSEDVSPGGNFQYNRNPHQGIYAIHRVDRETGEKQTWLRGPGGAVRPEVSPDGSRLAFIRRVGTNSALFVQDLESGRETMLWDGLSHDQQEAWSIFGTYPQYDWTPDGDALVIWAQGKLWRVDAATGEPTAIPFTAHVQQRITDAVRRPVEVAPEQFDVRTLRWATVSPDERSVVYSALGKLWIRPLPDGSPRRLTSEEHGWELYPSWSPDGRTIVYTTWTDAEQGTVRSVGVDGRGARTLTTTPGHYAEPAFSPDGQRVVFRHVGGDNLRGDLYALERGIFMVPAEGGEAVRVTGEGEAPRFDRTGTRLFLNATEDGQAALISVDLNGGSREVHLVSENATQIVPSPDGRYVALVERYNAYVAPFPRTGRSVHIGPGIDEYPIRRISRDAGNALHWSPDSRRVYWSLGPELFQRELGETFAFEAADGAELADEPEAEGRYIGFQAETDEPEGSLALVGATVISMRGDEVIPDATVVVEGNRITAVGPSSQVQVPADAERVDVAGKYLMPGLIDAHAHIGVGSDGIAPQSNWGFLANLAFGVTTMHDPSNDTESVFAASELIQAGEVTAPRLFSTGRSLYGAEGDSKVVVDSYADALSHLRRMQAVGAFTVKSYNQPRRDVRQMIVEAGRELGVMIVPEGGSTYHWNMTQVLDGHTGIEHNIPVGRLYKDALTLIGESETGYTPTLIVNFGGLSGEYYWYQESNVWENPRLRRFTPHGVLDSRSRRREMADPDDYQYVENARAAKAILDHGGTVQLGAHGQLQGLGAHWELWMLEQGGMTEMEALRAATLHGAAYLGLDGDLGSVEPGKLADLLVLDRNPLENIRNSEAIHYVVANGRLYDADTLEQLGNEAAPAPAAHWQGISTTWSQAQTEAVGH